MKTPICFIIFRRPEHTRRVFAQIRKAKPPTLIVVSDGPRRWRADDYPLVEAARNAIQVDWDCELIQDYADENMGCGVRMATGMDTAFAHVERCLMLEDDTLPHEDYFKVVDELLDRYAEHKHIWCISGARASREQMQPGAESYYFSHQIWTCSLATWRDRWAYYDFHVRQWADPVFKQAMYERLKHDPNELKLWVNAMEDAFVHSQRPRYQTMDYQFQAWVKAYGYGIVTSHNMVSNIGFDSMGTNATDPASPVANLPAYGMDFPLKHPPVPEPLPWGLPEHA